MKKLSIKGTMLGFGVAWAILMLAFSWISAFIGRGSEIIKLLSTVYIGYVPTFIGGIIGAVWGFISGVIWGAIISFVYNKTSF